MAEEVEPVFDDWVFFCVAECLTHVWIYIGESALVVAERAAIESWNNFDSISLTSSMLLTSSLFDGQVCRS